MPQGALAGLLAGLLALPAACDLPRDPEGTAERVRGGTLAVVVVAPRLTEGETAAVAALGEALGAEVALVPGDLHNAVAALGRGEAEVAVGAIPPDTPLAEGAAASNPIGREGTVMLLPAGENALLLLANHAVARAERGR